MDGSGFGTLNRYRIWNFFVCLFLVLNKKLMISPFQKSVSNDFFFNLQKENLERKAESFLENVSPSLPSLCR